MTSHVPKCLAAALLGVVLTAELHAQNDIITYQGHVQSNGNNFNGTGQFKFALVTSSNLNSTATATATISGGFVTIVTVIDGGSGYVNPPTVTLSGGGGSGASVSATISGGTVTGFTVDSPGSGYTSTPTVVLAPPPEDLLFTTYWSNDGTSMDGSEPMTAVGAPVSEGQFSVRLGDTKVANMQALGAGLFQQADLELRTWFDDGVNGFAVLSPTQPLTAAPYAMAVNMGAITDPSFIGTTGNQPLKFYLNHEPALRIEPTTETPNLIGGHRENTVEIGTIGAVIAGGGRAGDSNLIGTNSNHSVIGGGRSNAIEDSGVVTLAGGTGNTVGSSPGATLSGGAGNSLEGAYFSTIGGGQDNRLEATSYWSTIAGGVGNSMTTVYYGAIGGGNGNEIGANSGGSTIAGGRNNQIGSSYSEDSTIAGGKNHRIGDGAPQATIGGGLNNEIGDTSGRSVIGGGFRNSIGNRSQHATISGGQANNIASNVLEGVIGGGQDNLISDGALLSTIAGGIANTIGTNSFAVAIGGGSGNSAGNSIDTATIGGGKNNRVGSSSGYATVAGGKDNTIEANAYYSAIGGGESNTVMTGAYWSSVLSGSGNVQDAMWSVIGGGRSNWIGHQAHYSVIPGGRENAIGNGAEYAFAAGRRAKANHDGSFVWADSTDSDFASSGPDQLLIRASGNVGINKNNPATVLDVNGTVTATAFSGDGSGLTGLSIPHGSALDASDGSPSDVVYVDAIGNVGIGTVKPEQKLHIIHSSTPAIIDRTGSDGNLIRFRQNGSEEGSISVSGTTVSYNNFTGSHAAWSEQPIDRAMLVRLTGDNQRLHGNEAAEIVYGIEPTQRANDPAVLGTFLGGTEPSEALSLDNPNLVMAAGNGEVWVADTGRDIRPGDYLISSQVPGHAMVDDRAHAESHIIGRAGERVRWSDVSDTTDGVKHKKISLLFGAFTRNNTSAPERITRMETRLAELEALVSQLAVRSPEMLADD